MINLAEVEQAIIELELADTTFANCEKLASLYIVRDHVSTPKDAVINELNDILPSYNAYCAARQDYLMHKGSTETVLHQLNNLCREVSEFIDTLYINTDCEEARAIIKQTLTKLS